MPHSGAAPTNTVNIAGPSRSRAEGDVPEALRRKYLTESDRFGSVAFYLDATVMIPSFRDRGGQLVATRSDPNTVRDLIAIAQHRGWSQVSVTGATGFRREAWLAGTTLGLTVRGYQPGERDLQVLERRRLAQARNRDRTEGPDPGAPDARQTPRCEPMDPATRMKVVEAVVRNRLNEPTVQDRILARARDRLASLLERPRPGDLGPHQTAAPRRERQRG
jgi:hypothetical protein